VCIWISPGRLPRKPAHRTFGGYRFRLCVRMCSSCQTSDGIGGRRDDYGSALSAQPGESQRRPPTTRARSQSNAAACPHLRAPGASVPDGRAVRYDLRNRSRMLAPRILYDYQFDRVPQARTSSAPRSSASFPKTMPSSARRHIALGAEGRVGGEARPLHDTETLSLPRRGTRIFPARAAINAVSYIAPRLAQSCQIVDLRRKFFTCPQQKRDQPSRPRCFWLLGTCATSTRMALILLKYLVILNMSESACGRNMAFETVLSHGDG
jgi:hypothetical protein